MHANVGMVQMCKYKVQYQEIIIGPIMILLWSLDLKYLWIEYVWISPMYWSVFSIYYNGK